MAKMTNRRGFISILGAGLALDAERLLWVPGRKLISIPAPRSTRFLEAIGFRWSHDQVLICNPQPEFIAMMNQVELKVLKSYEVRSRMRENEVNRLLGRPLLIGQI